MHKLRKKNIPKTFRARLDNEYAQFTFLTVVRVDQSLLTVNTIKHATHNTI